MGKMMPVPREERPAVADRATRVMTGFTPVPRRYRYDGWTPERQKAFIGALAEMGCVTRAAARVNIAQTNCYELRKAPGAEEFRRAWDAALDFSLKRLKDIAFERAIEGYLVPVFVGGKLRGFRRKYNDALLMFCLRHYGQDAEGKRVTVNYFSARAAASASAGAQEARPPLPAATAAAQPVPALGSPPGCRPASTPLPSKSRGGLAEAEASAATVRTVVSGPSAGEDGAARLDAAAGVLNGFEGVVLDAEAEAEVAAAIEACAARERARQAALEEGGEAAADAEEDDPGQAFVRLGPNAMPYRATLEPGHGIEEFVPFVEGEAHWSQAGAEKPAELVRIEEALGAKQRAQAAAAPRRKRARRRSGGEPSRN
jgi:hypothetical protein